MDIIVLIVFITISFMREQYSEGIDADGKGDKMPRLIDADAFFNDFPELRDYEHASQDYEVDAVEVVRCKDCESWGLNTRMKDEKGDVVYGDCLHFCVATPRGFYCAWGERKNGQ